MSNLLSRHAECLFWMARQVERTNSLARILDVHETFSRDVDGAQNWESMLNLYADRDRFEESGRTIDAEQVLTFYILDRANPASVVSNMHYARENARALRPLISTEMWAQLNAVYNETRKWGFLRMTEEQLHRYCEYLKEACQTHIGIMEETLYRDESFYFHRLGTLIERADQVTRLVDVKYQILLPVGESLGSAVDVAQWNAVLRSAAAFHAFRRVHHRGMSPAKVAEFLIFNERFPRSVTENIFRASQMIDELRRDFALAGGEKSSQLLADLSARLRTDKIDGVLAGGMHEYMDMIQQSLIGVTEALSTEFFISEATPVHNQAA